METRFTRTTEPGLFGKLDESIKSFRVSSSTKEALQRQAAEQGIDLTTFLRALCDARAHGLDTVVTLTRKRYAAVSGKLSESSEAE